MPCNICQHEIDENQLLKCVTCRKCWHYPCVGYSDAEFNKILPMNKVKWRCADCKSNKNMKRSTSSLVIPSPNLNLHLEFESTPGNSPVSSPPPSTDHQHQQHQSMISLDTNALIAHFSAQLHAMRSEQREANLSVQAKLDELNKSSQAWQAKVAGLVESVKSLEEENKVLRREILTLKDNQDDMEQRARQCNVDIQNIPEQKNENLLNVVECIGNLIGVQLPSSYVVAVHRVARGQATSSASRPRNIIVQLATKRLRDDVIAAARARRGLNTEQLRLDSPTTKFYINEHLTLKNKILFSKVRANGRAKNYKYVWVRNSNIMAKKDDNSRIITVRRESDLEKL